MYNSKYISLWSKAPKAIEANNVFITLGGGIDQRNKLLDVDLWM